MCVGGAGLGRESEVVAGDGVRGDGAWACGAPGEE